MIKPIGNKVVVKVIQADKVTSGGIIILDTEKHLHPNRDAEVIATGNGKLLNNGIRVPLSVKPGDRVQINGICGVSTESTKEGKFAGEEIVITEDDIYLIYGE
ncbi:MAG: co-chaperone GroES [Ghiorsea sp.]